MIIITKFMTIEKIYNRINPAEWVSFSTTLLSAEWLKYEREISASDVKIAHFRRRIYMQIRPIKKVCAMTWFTAERTVFAIG